MTLGRPLLRFFWKARNSTTQNPSLLVIKLSALGDAVVLLPALYQIKEANPQVHITFLGGPSNRSLIECLPSIDQFVSFSSEGVISLLRERFDLIIDFDQWVRATALVSAALPTKQSAGFNSRGQWRHFAYDLKISFDTSKHTGENFWFLANKSLIAAGLKTHDSFQKSLSAVRTQWGPLLLGEKAPVQDSPYVVIHPGCGEHGRYREWPVSSWVQLLENLKKEKPALRAVVTGSGPLELEIAQKLEGAGAQSLVGKLSFRELLDLLRGAQGVFCGNTGIMHLASFLNDNVVALHGPTDPKLWKPLWGRATGNILSPLACAPCLTWGNDYGCSDPVCVKVITPLQVLEAFNA